MTTPSHVDGLTLPSDIYPTETLRAAYLNTRGLLRTNRIGVLDGPPGTGKTTAAIAIADSVDRPVIRLQVPHRPAPLEILRQLVRHIDGVLGSGTKSQMEEYLRFGLAEWGGLLIIDETQNLGADGIQELRYLHEACERAFALLLVGYQASATIAKYPDLRSRIWFEVRFLPLEGEELLQTVRTMHPILAATDSALIRELNSRNARGELRRWAMIAEQAATFGIKGGLDRATVDAILSLTRHNLTEEERAA